MILRAWQARALDALTITEDTAPNGAVVRAIMGAGKSIVIARLVERAMRAGYCVVVTAPSIALVDQLADTLSTHCACIVGRVRTGVLDVRAVTVVCHASLGVYEARYAERGVLLDHRIWLADECHSTECDTVHAWREHAPLSGSVGFTATPYRAEASDSLRLWRELAIDYGVDAALADGVIVEPTIQHCTDSEGPLAWCVRVWAQGRRLAANASSIADADEFAELLHSAGVPTLAVHSRSGLSAEHARRAIADRTHAIVYCSMLAEGFDAPALDAMCLRRAVSSRVRFAQEVGRGLRAHRGKTDCLQLDVHDLYGHHRITWREALGAKPEHEPIPALVLDEPPTPVQGTPREPRILAPEVSWLRAEWVRASMHGVISQRERYDDDRPATAAQLSAMARELRQLDPSGLPAPVRRRIKGVWGYLRKQGTINDIRDFADIVRALRRIT